MHSHLYHLPKYRYKIPLDGISQVTLTVGYTSGYIKEYSGLMIEAALGLNPRQASWLNFRGLTLLEVDLIHRLHPDGRVLRDLLGLDASIEKQEDTSAQ